MKKWINKIKGILVSWDKNNEKTTESESNIGEEKLAEYCPHCNSRKFVKKGKRKKKLEVVQLYKCRDCNKVFTAQLLKGDRFPSNVIIEALSYYNLGFNMEDTCRLLNQKFNVKPDPTTISRWVGQYSSLCRYDRLRPFGIKMYKPQEAVEVTTMAHRQIYRFRYHRAKIKLTLQEFKNRHFEPLKKLT